MINLFGAAIGGGIFLAEAPGVALPAAAATRRKAPRAGLLLSTAVAGALVLLGAPGSAQAQAVDACGPLDPSGAVTCTTGGNPYPGGIGYSTPPATAGDDVTRPETPVIDLSVVLDPGVAMALADPAMPGPAIALRGHNGGSVTLASGASSVVATYGDGQTGLFGITDAGALELSAPDIFTFGAGSRGIDARSNGGGSIRIDARSVYTYGAEARGISARAAAGGDVSVRSTGVISTYGDDSAGIVASTASGNVTIDAANVVTEGYASHGVVGIGDNVAIGVTGRVATAGPSAHAIYAAAMNGSAAVTLSGSIETEGFNAWGVTVRASGDAVLTGTGSIATHGEFARGVLAMASDGDAVVDLTKVTTTGESATAIVATSIYGDARVRVHDASTQGSYSNAIQAFSTYGDVSVTATGEVTTQGLSSTAISASSRRRTDISVDTVAAVGDDSSAIVALGDEVNVTITDAVSTTGNSIRTGGGLYQATVFAGAAVNPANVTDVPERSGIATILNNGSVSSSGHDTAGITAMGQHGVVISGTGSVATTGNRAVGIKAVAGGDITIGGGSVATTGAYSGGIFAHASGAGGVAIEVGAIRTDGFRTRGVDALSTGGDIAVRAGSVTTTGDRTVALFLTSEAQSGVARMTIDLDSLETSGVRARGVDAYSGRSDLDLSFAGSVWTTGDYSEGITAIGVNTNVVITGSITTQGNTSHGLYATGFEHATVTHDGTVAVSGESAVGLLAFGRGEVKIVSRGSVSSAGNFGAAISANTFDGNVTVDAGPVEARGVFAKGVRANALSGDIKVTLASANVSGFNSQGVDARTRGGNASVHATGRIDASGDGAVGVDAESTGWTIVEANDITMSGSAATAIFAVGGDIHITLNGAIRSDAYAGFNRFATVAAFTPPTPLPGTGGTITVLNNGTIQAAGHKMGGIRVRAASDVSISGAGSIRTGGHYSDAIDVKSYSGSVTVSQETIETAGIDSAGIRVLNLSDYDHGASIAFGSITTTGRFTRGVDVLTGGELRITGGSISMTGEIGLGVVARSFKDVDIDVASLTITGDFSGGITARTLGSAGGSVAIRLGNASATGREANLVTTSATSGSVDITGTGLLSVSGAGSTLIGAQAAGSISVTVNNANVAGTGSRGIVATAGEDATVTVTGTFTGSSNQATANSPMIAVSGYGTATLANSGAIRTTGTNQSAVEVRGYAGATVSVTGSIATTGDNARGVYAGANTLVASVRQTRVSTEGDDALAIVARSYGGAEVDVGSASTLGDRSTAILAEGAERVSIRAGTVSTAGASSHGIVARSYGSVSVTAGSVTALGAGSSAIYAQSEAITGVVIERGGTVSASGDTVVLSSGGGSSLVNDGTILGGGGGFVVRALGGGATVVNRGTIAGALLLTANADSVANGGLMALAGGTDFGAGNDSLNNSGTLLLAGSPDFGAGTDSFFNTGILAFASSGIGTQAVAPRSRTLAGLESFANAGLIDLRDGVVGDTLTTSGAFGGSGGSIFAIDVSLDIPAIADRLVIGGAASGSTTIVLNPLGGGDPLLQRGVTIVQTGAGTSANAFTLDPGLRFRGFIAFGLVYDAASGAFALAGAPAPTAYRLIKIGEGARSLWFDTADAIGAHMTDVRDAGDPARGVWFQASGAAASRREARDFTSFGFTQSVDLGYRQDAFGGQFGIDLDGDGLRFGVTGGYETSVMNFAAAADRATFDAFNGGVYASLRTGGFHISALAKVDHYTIRTALPSIGSADRFGGNGYGARVEAGYRLGSDRFYAEPSVSLAYVRTELDGTGAFGARVDFAGGTAWRGAAGLRLGSRREIGGGNMLTLYAAFGATRTFEDRGGIAFTTGATSLSFDNQRLGTYATGKLGASIGGRGVTGFIEAEGRYSSEYRGGAGRVGLRIGF